MKFNTGNIDDALRVRYMDERGNWCESPVFARFEGRDFRQYVVVINWGYGGHMIMATDLVEEIAASDETLLAEIESRSVEFGCKTGMQTNPFYGNLVDQEIAVGFGGCQVNEKGGYIYKWLV